MVETRGRVRPTKQAKSIGAPKAQIAAARKLAHASWWMLAHNEPFKAEVEDSTARKEQRMEARARGAAEEASGERLTDVGEKLIARAPLPERLAREAGNAG